MQFSTNRLLVKELRVEFQQYFSLSSKMPKSKKSPVGPIGKIDADKNKTKLIQKGAIYCGGNKEIVLKIHSKPGAKESGITDISDESVGIQISARPVDGEANKELIRYLAEILKLKKSELSLEKGSCSKHKTVVITGLISLENVLANLKAASKQ